MDELSAFHSTSSYHYSMQQAFPENNIVVGDSLVDYYAFPSPGVSFPMLSSDSDQLLSGPSMVSDAASMVTEMHGNCCEDEGDASEEETSSAIRAKIASHPLYPRLLQAFIDCQKVGASPEMAGMLDEIGQVTELSKRPISCLGADPELDEFMVSSLIFESFFTKITATLVKYKTDISRHFNKATIFLNDIEAQLHALCNTTITTSTTHISDEGIAVSDTSGEEVELQESASEKEDIELKDKLLQKYSGYISSLKHEFSKTTKKGKLPDEARQILLNWWDIHSSWPYPTEADKVALADATGLDQKQINNWFVNQRKRHWKLSDQNLQFAAVDILQGTLVHD